MQMRNFLTYILIVGFQFFTVIVTAQTNISGVINDYAGVTNIDYPTNVITVTSATNFSVGDRVLLIQMQGASIDQSQSSSFGTISSFNNAGNYEFQTICTVTGNDITLTYDILNAYSTTGSVQLVRIPVYTDALISGSNLTAQAWNGTTGGILAIEVDGTLDFGSNDIDVSGFGFRGGTSVTSGQGCSSWGVDGNYYTSSSSSDQKAYKGEGIAEYISGRECSRGPQANGGGGGNNHNGGGGGGANYGYGGSGGQRIKRSTFTCGSNTGVNSKSLSSGYSSSKIFLGGGGGSGHGNNAGSTGENGADGGGLVIIKAGSIQGNNRSILANGNSNIANASNDGGGGGGAGGTILLDVVNYSTAINASVSGGKGASVINTGTSNCNGPGGGGGAGVIAVTNSSIPGNLSITYSPGQAGTILTTSQTNCTVGSTNGATNGQNGTSISNFIFQEGLVPIGCGGVLPVELIDFSARVENKIKVKLEWVTASEINNDFFIVQRSKDGREWESLIKKKGAGTTTSTTYYYHFDHSPHKGTSYYRLKQYDLNGDFTYSDVRMVKIDGIKNILLYPNPSQGIVNLNISSTEKNAALLYIFDSNGRLVYQKDLSINKGDFIYNTDLSFLNSGFYFIKIFSLEGDYTYNARFGITK